MPLDPAMLAKLRGGGAPMPPSMQKPPGTPAQQPAANVGGATSPGGQMGNVSQAIAKVRSALQMLEEALPMIPSGHDMHVKVLQQAKDLAKALKDVGNDPGLQIQSMLQSVRQQMKQAPTNAMARIFPQQGGEPQPPAMPGGDGGPPAAMAA